MKASRWERERGVDVKPPNNVISDGSHVYVENMAANYQQGDSGQ